MAETQSTGEQTSDDSEQKKGRFEPKVPVKLEPPKDEPISVEYLSKCTGTLKPLLPTPNPFIPQSTNETQGLNPEYPTYVAIKGLVYNVTGNKAYGPDGPYKIFAGHDASRALGKTSTKEEDVRPEWEDLPETEKKTLEDWVIFFGKRYSVVGVVEGSTNGGDAVKDLREGVKQEL